MTAVKLIVGGSLEDDAAAFLDAWHRTGRGGKVRERTVAFESWEALAGVLTGDVFACCVTCMPIPNRRCLPSPARLAASTVAFTPTLKPLKRLAFWCEFKALYGRPQTPSKSTFGFESGIP
jgi:hypothetical protein